MRRDFAGRFIFIRIKLIQNNIMLQRFYNGYDLYTIHADEKNIPVYRSHLGYIAFNFNQIFHNMQHK